MTQDMPAFDDDLPSIIPMFPLPSALLLPGGHLPLNIFEPRYLAMVDAALASPDRLIGMVQPTEDDQAMESQNQPVPGLFSIGCAGRITYFQETEDQRYLIALTGVSRFRLMDQRLQPAGFRHAEVDWDEFQTDLQADTSPIDRQPLIAVMKQYFKLKGFDADWSQIEQSNNDQLLATLSMVCPFEVAEKQALLEANDSSTRADLLIAMMEMACMRIMEVKMPATDTNRASAKSGDVDPRLLDVLVCPLTRSALHYDRARQELISQQARKAFPVRAGVPIMLVEEARDLADDE
jgi:Lon protease-like protein/uncharacterized protein YbaR (Trm112 family)